MLGSGPNSPRNSGDGWSAAMTADPLAAARMNASAANDSLANVFIATALRNDDRIAGLELDVLIQLLAAHDRVVIEWQLHLPALFLPHDEDRVALRVLLEAAGVGDELQHRHRPAELIDAGLLDLTRNEHLAAVDLLHDDRRVWILDVVRGFVVDAHPQLLRSEACCLDVVQQRCRDLAVRPDGDVARHVLVAPEQDGEDILRPDDVAGRRRRE